MFIIQSFLFFIPNYLLCSYKLHAKTERQIEIGTLITL